MEIEVGEYVRTKRGIAKVLEVKTVQPKMHGQHDVAYKIDKCPKMNVTETAFIKHNPNIRNLIEVRRLCEFRKDTRYNRRLY